MLFPVLVGFGTFVLYPNLWIITLSFFKYNGVTDPKFIGLDNYVRAFTDDDVWWQSVAHTFVFTVGKLLVEIPLALFLAVILNNQLRGRNFFRGIFFLPNITSTAVMSLVFFFIFAPYQGILNGLLQNTGIIDEPINWLGNPTLALISVMFVSIWQNFGINMILLLAGLQGIPQDVYESGDLDGATGFKRFWYLTLPMLSRMFQVILMLAIVGSLKVFDIVKVLTDGGPTRGTEVMVTYIYKFYFPTSHAAVRIPQMGYASALGVIASLIIGVVTIVYLFMSRKMDNDA